LLHTHLSDPHAPYNLGKRRGSEYERYLAEVRLVDDGLRRLLASIEQFKLTARTILIVQADHGEAFGEHNSKTHGTTLYDEALRVPLLILAPGVSARRIDDLVTTMDLGPSILDLFGVPTPGYFMGQSLVAYMKGGSPRLTRPVLAENRLQQALILPNGLKVIYDTRTRIAELYDLLSDPEETNDLSDDTERLREPLLTLKTFFDVHRYRDHGYEPPFVR
jgi:arylsulfatase A-like enzyme